MLLGVAAAGLNLAALAGASIAAGAVFAFSLGRSGWNPYRVLLTGVALASGFGALVGLMLSLAPSSQVQGMLFWLLGDLSPAGDPSAALVVLAGCAALAFSQSAALDVLILGEDKARSLGVAVRGCSRSPSLARRLPPSPRCCSAARSVSWGWWCRTCCGFTGVYRHSVLLPLSACLGGSLLALAIRSRARWRRPPSSRSAFSPR